MCGGGSWGHPRSNCGRWSQTPTASIGTPELPMVTDARAPGEVLGPGRHRLRMRLAGVPIEWEESPFEWVVPSRFGVVRRYGRGPAPRDDGPGRVGSVGDRPDPSDLPGSGLASGDHRRRERATPDRVPGPPVLWARLRTPMRRRQVSPMRRSGTTRASPPPCPLEPPPRCPLKLLPVCEP